MHNYIYHSKESVSANFEFFTFWTSVNHCSFSFSMLYRVNLIGLQENHTKTADLVLLNSTLRLPWTFTFYTWLGWLLTSLPTHTHCFNCAVITVIAIIQHLRSSFLHPHCCLGCPYYESSSSSSSSSSHHSKKQKIKGSITVKIHISDHLHLKCISVTSYHGCGHGALSSVMLISTRSSLVSLSTVTRQLLLATCFFLYTEQQIESIWRCSFLLAN